MDLVKRYLSGVVEADQVILLNLDLSSIIRLRQVSAYFHYILLNESFWRMKVDQDFGIVSQFKPHNESYEQQYKYFITGPQDDSDNECCDDTSIRENISYQNLPPRKKARDAVKYNRIDVLEWLIPAQFIPDSRFLNRNISCFTPEPILYWLSSKGFRPDEESIDDLIFMGDFYALDWLISLGHIPNDRWAFRALKEGQFDWLIKHKLRPTPSWIFFAKANNTVYAIEWLSKQRLDI